MNGVQAEVLASDVLATDMLTNVPPRSFRID
jgi:hypothetical protein